MGNEYELTQEESKRIFDDEIAPYIFEGLEPVSDPKFILVGGQPGSGKTELVVYSRVLLGKNSILVDGDLLRRFHPSYEEIYQRYGADASFYTHPDCARWSIMAIKHAREKGYNVILENTLRRPTICDTIELFAKRGYEIIVKIMVVSDIESKLGLFQRYFDALSVKEHSAITPRYNSVLNHNECCMALPNTIDMVQKQNLSSIEFYRRSTENIERIMIPRGAISLGDFYLYNKSYPYTDNDIEYLNCELLRISKMFSIFPSSDDCKKDFAELEVEIRQLKEVGSRHHNGTID